MKRLFIAVPIQEKSRKEISDGILKNQTIQQYPVRWTNYNNLHLTLQFLGDTEEKKIPLLKDIVGEINASINSETLRFTSIGAFPNNSAAKIIWLGFQRNDTLTKCQRLLSDKLVDNGFETDRKKFRPHLTLGRVRDNAIITDDMFSYIENLRSHISISESKLEKITLFESQLRPGGPIYTAL